MKRNVLIIGAIVAGLVLSGCSQVNMAAKVGDKEITTNTVQKSINEILKERKRFDLSNSNLPKGAALNLSILQFHLYSVLFDSIAKDTGITVTEGDIAKERAAVIAQVGAEDKLPMALANASIAQADFDRYLRSIIVVAKIREGLKQAGDTSTDNSGLQKLITAAGQKHKVEINPRYGRWNYDSGSIEQAPANPAIK